MTAQIERLESCNGLAQRAFITKPDTKFNPDGLFKIKLDCDLGDASVLAFKEKVDEAVDVAFLSEVPARLRDGWSRWLPYELDEPRNRVVFDFKRSAVVTLSKTKERVALSVGVFDSTGAFVASPPDIRDGSLVRVFAQFRPIKVTASRCAGMRMDFSAIKVLRLALPPSPFSDDNIEDGWK